MLIIVLNGPINAGKTTTGRAMAALLPNSRFLDGDDHDAPDDAPLAERIEASFARIVREIEEAEDQVMIIAVPLRDQDYLRLQSAARSRHATLKVVTLAPPVEVASASRGDRLLTAAEADRSRQMYVEGYTTRPFSDLTIVEMSSNPHTTAQQIIGHFALAPGA